MTLRRAISGATAAALVLLSAVTTGGVAAAEPATATITSVADPETYHAYPGAGTQDAVTYFNSTSHAGRIWTDKSVFDSTITVDAEDAGGTAGGSTGAVAPQPVVVEPGQLAVALSALGATRHVTSEIPTPIDVVLVLDVSTSMTYCITQTGSSNTTTCTEGSGTRSYVNSRAYAMVEAVNTAMRIIVEDSEGRDEGQENRVALASFSTGANELQSLGVPRKISGSDDYVQLVRSTSGSATTLSVKYATGPTSTDTVQINGYTNTQLGFSAGMNLLASQDPATVTKDNQRLANVVFLTDGEPTRSSSGENWWAPSGTAQPSSGAAAYYGNGFKAAMTAAYLKNKIAKVYGNPENPIQVDPKVYTIGLGVTGLSVDGKALSMATLDPAKNLWSEDNAFFKNFNAAFEEYSEGGAPAVTVGSGSGASSRYTVKQVPTDDPNQVEDLRYNDAFYAPVTTQNLIDAFTEIAKQIIAPVGNPPTETDQGSAGASGYVTFTDPLGPFMQVDRIDQLTFCSVQGDDPDTCKLATFTPNGVTTSTELVDTYTFSGSYAANDIYGTSNIGDIKVKVERFANPAIGDKVTVQIPASLLPLRNSYIEEDVNGKPTSMDVTVSHPVHLYYVVEPKAGVLDNLGDPYALNKSFAGAGDALAQYVRSNTTDGRVRFYSNDYTVAAGGNQAKTTAIFTPAEQNLFYRFGKDTTLYSDAAATQTITKSQWDKLGDDASIHYVFDSYKRTGVDAKSVVEDPVILTTTKALLELPGKDAGTEIKGRTLTVVNGAMTAPKGMRDFSGRATNLDHIKCSELSWADGVPSCSTTRAASSANETETAEWVRSTTYAGQSVVASLGNNGLISAPVPGRLSISKEVVYADSLHPKLDQTFDFTVTFDGTVAQGAVFPYAVYAQSDLTTPLENRGGSVGSGGVIKLKHGEVAEVTGLPSGATYEVSEGESLPAGFMLTSPTEAATGTITVPQESPARADFINTYAPAATPAVETPAIQKLIDGEGWAGRDTFTAKMCPDVGGDCVEATLGTGSPTPKAFGEIAFEEPGRYVFTITEVDEDALGFSYSGAVYSWVVTVTDDGSGRLSASGVLTQMLDDAGAPTSEPAAVAVFTNEYSIDSERGNLLATKWVEDQTLPGNPHRAPTLSHDFFYWYLTSSDGAPDAPLFQGGTSEATVSTTGSSVTSPEMTFTQDHVGHVYYYAVKELPNTAHDGVEYDKSAFVYRLEVKGPAASGAQDSPKVQVTSTRCKTQASAIVDRQVPEGCTFSGSTSATFLNIYRAAEATAELGATKTLTGRPWAEGDEFTFDLTTLDTATIAAIDAGIVTMPETPVTVTGDDQVDGTAKFSFGKITFTKQGSYQFRVLERASALPDVVDDLLPVVYNVVVTDPDVDGSLDIAVTVRDGQDSASFVNRWVSAMPYDGVDLKKALTGRDLRWNEFSFTVTANDAASAEKLSIPAEGKTVTNGENHGDISLATVLGPVTFTQADLDRTFTYTVVENNTGLGGVTYDETSHTVIITPVYDADAGVLDVITTVDGVEYSALLGQKPVVTFTNAYVPATWDLVKSSDREAAVAPGQEITYTITATNTSKDGAAPLTNVVITDDLSDVLGTEDNPKAHWVGFVGDDGEVASIEGSTLMWKLDQLTGSETLSYTVRIDDAAHDVTLRNAVTGMGGVDPDGDGGGDVPPESCVAGTPVANLDDDCVTVHVTGPGWTIAKSSPTASVVKPGDTIEYVVDVTFLGREGSVIPGVVVVDDLSDVLEHATPDLESIVPSVGAAELVDGVLRWTIGDLRKNASLTYAVTVNDDAHGVDLVNVVTGSGGTDEDEDGEGETPPVACATGEDPRCTTVHTTDPAWTIAKSSPTASEVKPGDTIEYVVDVTLLGDEGRSIPSVVVIDDLSDVLEHATPDRESIVPSVGKADLLDDGTLRWEIGDLTGNARLRYTVTVREDAIGATLRNVVTGMGNVDQDGEGDLPPATCAAGTDSDDLAEECTTVHTTDPTWSLSKSSDDPDGKAVPGQVITYTLTATVSGADRVTVPNVDVIDDLSGLLDHASLVEGSLKASQGQAEPGDDGSSLVWHLDELTGEATLTYQVVVDDNAYGVDLVNVVTGSGGPDGDGDGEGDNPPTACAAEGEDLADQCTTVHTTDPTWNLAKSSDDPDGKAEPGQLITYTLTATPVGENVDALTDLVITDDLSDVVGDGKATFVEILDKDADAERSEDGTTLVWKIDRLTETATLRYSVKVDVEAYGVTLRNVVTGTGGDGTYPPATCAAPELMADAAALDATPTALSLSEEEFIDEECSTTHVTDAAPTEPDPEPVPDPTEPPEDPSTGSGQPPIASDPADPVDVSTGGALARSGATLAALAAAAGLMTMAGLLLAHRRRKESTE